MRTYQELGITEEQYNAVKNGTILPTGVELEVHDTVPTWTSTGGLPNGILRAVAGTKTHTVFLIDLDDPVTVQNYAVFNHTTKTWALSSNIVPSVKNVLLAEPNIANTHVVIYHDTNKKFTINPAAMTHVTGTFTADTDINRRITMETVIGMSYQPYYYTPIKKRIVLGNVQFMHVDYPMSRVVINETTEATRYESREAIIAICRNDDNSYTSPHAVIVDVLREGASQDEILSWAVTRQSDDNYILTVERKRGFESSANAFITTDTYTVKEENGMLYPSLPFDMNITGVAPYVMDEGNTIKRYSSANMINAHTSPSLEWLWGETAPSSIRKYYDESVLGLSVEMGEIPGINIAFANTDGGFDNDEGVTSKRPRLVKLYMKYREFRILVSRFIWEASSYNEEVGSRTLQLTGRGLMALMTDYFKSEDFKILEPAQNRTVDLNYFPFESIAYVEGTGSMGDGLSFDNTYGIFKILFQDIFRQGRITSDSTNATPRISIFSDSSTGYDLTGDTVLFSPKTQTSSPAYAGFKNASALSGIKPIINFSTLGAKSLSELIKWYGRLARRSITPNFDKSIEVADMVDSNLGYFTPSSGALENKGYAYGIEQASSAMKVRVVRTSTNSTFTAIKPDNSSVSFAAKHLFYPIVALQERNNVYIMLNIGKSGTSAFTENNFAINNGNTNLEIPRKVESGEKITISQKPVIRIWDAGPTYGVEILYKQRPGSGGLTALVYMNVTNVNEALAPFPAFVHNYNLENYLMAGYKLNTPSRLKIKRPYTSVNITDPHLMFFTLSGKRITFVTSKTAWSGTNNTFLNHGIVTNSDGTQEFIHFNGDTQVDDLFVMPQEIEYDIKIYQDKLSIKYRRTLPSVTIWREAVYTFDVGEAIYIDEDTAQYVISASIRNIDADAVAITGTVDPGEAPMGGLQRAIEGLPVRMFERANGDIRIYKWEDRPSAHTFTKERIFGVQNTHDNRELYSHVRMIGGYVEAEYLHTPLLPIVGQRFIEVNNPMLFTEDECYEEARDTVRRCMENAERLNFSAVYVPVLEIEDRVTVEGYGDWIIDNISIDYSPGVAMANYSLRRWVEDF